MDTPTITQEARDLIADAAADLEVARAELEATAAAHAVELEKLKADHGARVAELETTIEKLEAETASLRDSLAALPEFARLDAVVAAGIPAEHLLKIAKMLQGDSPEQLRAHAEQFQQLFFPKP